MAITQSVHALISSSDLNALKRDEDSINQGINYRLSTVVQIGQQILVISKFCYFKELLGKSCSQWKSIYTIIPTIGVSLLLGLETLKNKQLIELCQFIHDHVGTVCHLAAAVTSIAFIAFGLPAYGWTSLSILGLGLLDRQGFLPSRLRQIYHTITPWIVAPASLIVGSTFERVLTTLELLQRGLDFLNRKIAVRSYPDNGEQKVNLIAMKCLLSSQTPAFAIEKLGITINKGYVKYPTLPPVPADVSIGDLYEKIFKSVNWEKQKELVRIKVENDTRWDKINRGKYKDDPLLYVDAMVKQLVDKVTKKEILEGEPLDYQDLEGYLKIIIKLLEKASDDDKAESLMRLAIEGSDYCGPGLLGAVDDEVHALAYEAEEGADSDFDSSTAIRKKILLTLQNFRKRVFQREYDKNLNLLWFFSRSNDPHSYNTILRLFEADFGIPYLSAQNDSAAKSSELSAAIISILFHFHIKRIWREDLGSPDKTIEELHESVGTRSCPISELYLWYCNWVQRQPFSNEEKESVIDGIANNSLFGHQLADPETNKFNPLFLIPILLESGVFHSNNLEANQ